MSIAFLIIGIIMVMTGVRGTYGDLATLLKGEFTGDKNFLKWILAILIVGSLGYFKPIRPIANGILALVIIGLLLSNKGFFSKFQSQLGY